jgi:hypothetical protein
MVDDASWVSSRLLLTRHTCGFAFHIHDDTMEKLVLLHGFHFGSKIVEQIKWLKFQISVPKCNVIHIMITRLAS